jgi:hypothetical protein
MGFMASDLKSVKELMLPPLVPTLPYTDIYTEIKGGIWAVALAFVVIWVATANIRRSLGFKLGKVIDEHLELVNDTKAITKDTNDRVKDIQKKVDDFLR